MIRWPVECRKSKHRIELKIARQLHILGNLEVLAHENIVDAASKAGEEARYRLASAAACVMLPTLKGGRMFGVDTLLCVQIVILVRRVKAKSMPRNPSTKKQTTDEKRLLEILE